MDAIQESYTQCAGHAEYAQQIHDFGFAVFPEVLTTTEVDLLRTAIESIPDGEAVRRKREVYGVRNLLDIAPAIRRLAALGSIRRFVTPILGDGAFATRAIFFDKNQGANWALGWHQDSVIAVRKRIDVPGFLAWGLKAGAWQVQPPPEIMAHMIAVRVHLDDCGPENGPLRVIPGSHRHGWLDNEISRWKREVASVPCIAKAGGVVAMRPLILHASTRAVVPTHRRVVHIEFANEELPGGLEWRHRISGTETTSDTPAT